MSKLFNFVIIMTGMMLFFYFGGLLSEDYDEGAGCGSVSPNAVLLDQLLRPECDTPLRQQIYSYVSLGLAAAGLIVVGQVSDQLVRQDLVEDKTVTTGGFWLELPEGKVKVKRIITPLKALIVLARDTSHLDCSNAVLSVGNRLACVVVDLWLFYFVIASLGAGVAFLFAKKVVVE